MTAILAIDFYYEILVIADCRVSWGSPLYKPQDNLQKIYPLGPSGVLGFAGGVREAKKVISHIRDEAKITPLVTDPYHLIDLISSWSKKSYKKINNSNYLELMYSCVDTTKSGYVAENITLGANILTKFKSPNFSPEYHHNFVRLGYASEFCGKEIIKHRKGLIGIGLNDPNQYFIRAVGHEAFGNHLSELAPSVVGGMFSVGIISREGVTWSNYENSEGYQLVIENGKFIQYDTKNNRKVPLKTVFEFNPSIPDAGNLMFSPSV